MHNYNPTIKITFEELANHHDKVIRILAQDYLKKIGISEKEHKNHGPPIQKYTEIITK